MSSGPSGETYRFTTINNIALQSVVHVCGIVSYVGPCSTTRKGDQCRLITLVDESVEDRSWGLKCNIFSKEKCQLPPDDCLGKVLCFHKLWVGSYQNRPQGRGNCTHGNLTWVLFPRDIPNEKPSSSSCSHVLTTAEVDRSKELYSWWDQVEAADRERESGESVDVARQQARIEDLWPGGSYYDLCVQVLGIYFFPGENSAMLRVWDGTPRKYTPCHAVPHLLEDAKATISHAPVPKDLTIDVFLFDNHVAKAKELELLDFVELRNVIAKPFSNHLKEFIECRCPHRFTEPYKDYMQVLLRTGNSFGRGIFSCSTASPQGIALKAQLKSAFDLQLDTNIVSCEETDKLMKHIQKLKEKDGQGSSKSGTNAGASSWSYETMAEDLAVVNVISHLASVSSESTTNEPSGECSSNGPLVGDGGKSPTSRGNLATAAAGGSEPLLELVKRSKPYITKYISELRPSAMFYHLLVEILDCQGTKDTAKLTVWDGTKATLHFRDLELEGATNMLGPSLPADYTDFSSVYKVPIYISGEILETIKSFKLLDIVVLRNVMVVGSNKRRMDDSIESGSVTNVYCVLGDLNGTDKPEAFVMAPDTPAVLTLRVRLGAVRQQVARNKQGGKDH